MKHYYLQPKPKRNWFWPAIFAIAIIGIMTIIFWPDIVIGGMP